MSQAMIVVNLNTGQLFIPYDNKDKLKLVKDDKAAHVYVEKNLPHGRLLGTFPDPTKLVKQVMESDK